MTVKPCNARTLRGVRIGLVKSHEGRHIARESRVHVVRQLPYLREGKLLAEVFQTTILFLVDCYVRLLLLD